MKEYKPEAEGALFEKPESVPLTSESMRELALQASIATEATWIDDAKQLALSILRAFHDSGVELDESGFPLLDGERIANVDTALLNDSLELLRRTREIERLRADLLADEPSSTRLSLNWLMTKCVLIGQFILRIEMRANGFESAVKFSLDRDIDLKKGRPQTALTPEQETRAKNLLSDGISQRRLAKELGISAKVARRLHEEHHEKNPEK